MTQWKPVQGFPAKGEWLTAESAVNMHSFLQGNSSHERSLPKQDTIPWSRVIALYSNKKFQHMALWQYSCFMLAWLQNADNNASVGWRSKRHSLANVGQPTPLRGVQVSNPPNKARIGHRGHLGWDSVPVATKRSNRHRRCSWLIDWHGQLWLIRRADSHITCQAPSELITISATSPSDWVEQS